MSEPTEYVAPLGFSIDLEALDKAETRAQSLYHWLSRLADAQDRLTASQAKGAMGVQSGTDAALRATDAAKAQDAAMASLAVKVAELEKNLAAAEARNRAFAQGAGQQRPFNAPLPPPPGAPWALPQVGPAMPLLGPSGLPYRPSPLPASVVPPPPMPIPAPQPAPQPPRPTPAPAPGPTPAPGPAPNPGPRPADPGLDDLAGSLVGVNANLDRMLSLLQQGQIAMAGGGGFMAATTAARGALAAWSTGIGTGTLVAAGLTLGVTALAGAYVGLVGATAGAQQSQAVMLARLDGIYQSGTRAADVLGRLRQVATDNGALLDPTADAFLRTARNNETIGLTTNEQLQLTSGVQRLGAISGATSGEIQSGLFQFNQALSSNRLSGDELRTIQENLPELTKQIAAGLGVSVGRLREMGAAGELTGDKIARALLGRMDEINAEFEGLPTTMEMAGNRTANEWDRMLAAMGQRLRASDVYIWWESTKAGAFGGIADALAPETNGQRIASLQGQVATTQEEGWGGFIARNLLSGVMQGTTGGDASSTGGGTDAQARSELFVRQEAERMLRWRSVDRADVVAEQVARAPIVRGDPVLADLDQNAKKLKAFQEQLVTLRGSFERLNEMSLEGPLSAADQERLDRTREAMAALDTQIASVRTVLGAYTFETGRMRTFRQEGSGIGVGEQAYQLVQQAAAAGQDLSMSDASNAVLGRRREDTEALTAANERALSVEFLRIDAIGKGTAAAREAEVQAEAWRYEVETFGENAGPDAAAAVDAYANSLRSLKALQDEAAAAQQLLNAQLEGAGLAAQIAAVAAGQTAGQVAALGRANRLAVEVAGITGVGGFAPVEPGGYAMGVPVGPGGGSASGGSAGAGGVALEYSMGPNRPNAPSADVTSIITSAVEAALGPGSRVVVTSGQEDDDNGDGVIGPSEQYGSPRHGTGHAADVAIYDPSGARISATDPRMQAVALEAARRGATGIGFGSEYMGGDHMHVDTVGTSLGGGHAWASGANAIEGQLVAAMGGGGSSSGTSIGAGGGAPAFPTGVPVGGIPSAGAGIPAGLDPASATAYALALQNGDNATMAAILSDMQRRQGMLRGADQASSMGGLTGPARREEEIRQAGDNAAFGADPSQAEALRSAAVAEARARAEAGDATRLAEYAQETDQLREQAGLHRGTRREREIALETQRLINAELAAGNELTAEEIGAIRSAATERWEATDVEGIERERAANVQAIWSTTADGIGSALQSSLRAAAKGSKIEVGEIATDLLADITASVAQAFIVAPLTRGIEGVLGNLAGRASGIPNVGAPRMTAHGAAFFGHGGLPGIGDLSGSILTSPTLFAFGGGRRGLAGEAGPEAVMPLVRVGAGFGVRAVDASGKGGVLELHRGSDGMLGVALGSNGPAKAFATGGTPGVGTWGQPGALPPSQRPVGPAAAAPMSVVINDQRADPNGPPIEVEESTGPDGRRAMQVTVRDEVSRQITGGQHDRAMGKRFGAAPRMTTR